MLPETIGPRPEPVEEKQLPNAEEFKQESVQEDQENRELTEAQKQANREWCKKEGIIFGK